MWRVKYIGKQRGRNLGQEGGGERGFPGGVFLEGNFPGGEDFPEESLPRLGIFLRGVFQGGEFF